MKFLATALFLSFVAFSVHAQECYMRVTTGGGVTGGVTDFKIQPDGKVMKGSGVGEIDYTQSAKLKKSRTKKYFREIRSLMAAHPEFNHPGNMYSSIMLYENGTEKKITWGDVEHKTPEDVKKLYEKITASLGVLTFSQELRK
jgi:hypothetical protein